MRRFSENATPCRRRQSSRPALISSTSRGRHRRRRVAHRRLYSPVRWTGQPTSTASAYFIDEIWPTRACRGRKRALCRRRAQSACGAGRTRTSRGGRDLHWAGRRRSALRTRRACVRDPAARGGWYSHQGIRSDGDGMPGRLDVDRHGRAGCTPRRALSASRRYRRVCRGGGSAPERRRAATRAVVKSARLCRGQLRAPSGRSGIRERMRSGTRAISFGLQATAVCCGEPRVMPWRPMWR